ncbi:Neuropeptides capa receptor [Aphelenchoides besseyi]|nr:Neuropeptides capa receptor [Aphelenchoides besseyi]
MEPELETEIKTDNLVVKVSVDLYENCDPITYEDTYITNYVLQQWGPRCAMDSIITPTVVIYALILFFGVVGNICTCIVIAKNQSMRNPTNYYLFSLAISDLLMLILGLPMELYGVVDVTYPYRFSETVCKLRAFLIEFTSYASILTITSFSLERWLAICFPLRAKLFSTFDRAVKMIICVWVGAFLAAFPVFFIVVINRVKLPTPIDEKWFGTVSFDNKTIANTELCALDLNAPEAQRTFILSAFFVFFLLPAIVITVVYCHIMLKIRESDRYMMADQQKTNRHKKSLLRMLVAVVLMFFICWVPFHIQRLISIYINETGGDNTSAGIGTLYSVAFYLSGYFYYSNSACNPILYNLLSSKYRRAFCKTILCRQCTKHCYKTDNISTFSKHQQSGSRRSATARTRSLTRTDTAGSRKKISADIPQQSNEFRRTVRVSSVNNVDYESQKNALIV